MRSVRLTLRERNRLHKAAEAVYARLIAKSSKFQPIINNYENRTVRTFTLSLIALGFVGGVFLSFLFGPSVAERTGFAPLNGTLGPVIFGGVGALLFYFVVDRLGRTVSSVPLYQQVAEAYVFNSKWVQPKSRLLMASAALNWLQRQPEMTFEATDFLYGTEDGGDVIPPRIASQVRDVAQANQPSLVLREFFERKLKSEYLANGLASSREALSYQQRYFIQSRAARNGIRASLVLNALGCELRDEIPTGEQWRRGRFTDPDAQITTLRDNEDVTLRYRTGAPHYRWPDDKREKSRGETAPYLLYASIENPTHLPLYVITVQSIIEKLDEAIRWQFPDEDLSEVEIAAEVQSVLNLLSTTDVEMFGKWDKRTLRQRSEVALIPQPVLANLSGDLNNPDWALRWDPNRIDWSQFLGTDGAIRRAFAALLRCIELADEEAEAVVLTRGDALLVDNQRAMVRRRETGLDGASYVNNLFDYPEAWWLNVYYGFRQSEKPDFLGI